MQALLIDIEGWEIQMERLLKQIEAYKPCNEQEEKDRELLIQWIRSGRDIVTRANETAHLTASAWVVSPDRKHVLMAYHNIYNSWAWLGGHADGRNQLGMGVGEQQRVESGTPGSGRGKRTFSGHTTAGGTDFTGDSDCGWSLEAWNVCVLSSSSERYLSYGSRSQETNT